ncbi:MULTISPECIES: hypothetical protein [Bacillus]|uniref:hypothetical protein n=1 Tax=Bacillus TaxID=1386 RepID=UPI0002D3C635|nr:MULTISPECIES: hypothetical protein [Bacillus]
MIQINSLLHEQYHFLQEHLTKFVPEFSERVIHHAKSSFYKGLAEILQGFIEMDPIVLQELLKIDLV